MSDETDAGSKTEAPTEQRLQDAFEEGQFAQAPEIGVVAILIAAYGIFVSLGKTMAAQSFEGAIRVFSNLANWEITEMSVSSGIIPLVGCCLMIIGPILLTCVVAGVVAGGLQTQFRLTPKVLHPKFSRLDPVKGFNNIFSKAAAVRFALDSIKFVAVGIVLYIFIKEAMRDAIFHFCLPVEYLGTFIFDTSIAMLSRLIAVLAIVASLSYLYQRRKVLQDLKMTIQEIKEERKRMEVSPQVRSAQRRMARRFLQKQMMAQVPLADVIVTNPTHYAVALKYERGQDQAPRVVAKGDNQLALKIIALAKQHEVPRVENRPVARLLYKMAKVGEPIPMELYQAVAEILAHVYKTYRYYFHRLKARRLESVSTQKDQF